MPSIPNYTSEKPTQRTFGNDCLNPPFSKKLSTTLLLFYFPLEPVIKIAEELLRDGVVPQKAADDAFHIACAGVHHVDFLLTWNCTHIANPHNRHRIERCFARYQITVPVICTPEEFIGDNYADYS